MARVRTESARKGGKKQSRSTNEARGRRAARKAAAERTPPEALDLPGVEQARDKDLEKYGRELVGLGEAKKANDRMIKACRGRIDKRLAETGLHIYRLAGGGVLTATDKRVIKVEAQAPKAKRKPKRKSEAEGVRG
jgi:hypothetical protein